MKVIAINGSPNAKGNTRIALDTVAAELVREGIEVEVVQVGNRALQGCQACGKCAKTKDEKCALPDDGVNGAIQKIKAADGLLLGSPVHFSGISGMMKAFLDRAFYVAGSNGSLFRHKVGAAVVAVRRSGGVTTFDQLNHYLVYCELLLPAANYWNVIHGAAQGEATQDTEGIQLMRVLGKNMAWLMRLVAHGKGTIPEPEREQKVRMNFIR